MFTRLIYRFSRSFSGFSMESKEALRSTTHAFPIQLSPMPAAFRVCITTNGTDNQRSPVPSCNQMFVVAFNSEAIISSCINRDASPLRPSQRLFCTLFSHRWLCCLNNLHYCATPFTPMPRVHQPLRISFRTVPFVCLHQ